VNRGAGLLVAATAIGWPFVGPDRRVEFQQSLLQTPPEFKDETPIRPRRGRRGLGRRHERLALVIARAARCSLRPNRLGSLFTVLLRAIVYQQLNSKAASTIVGRVETLFPGGRVEPAALLAMPEEALRGAGLSRNKLASVRDLATRTLDGTIPSPADARQLNDAELVARLTEVRGIGPWTVHMLLMFDLGRPDVMPAGDYGVRMGFKKLYGKRSEPSPAQIERHAARWHPYRSVAAWYLWRVHEIELP
jgi:3-methyladenine DNA glycosylase/8-oxoguanine DNA glycosylase